MPGPRPAIVELDSAVSELFYTIRRKLPNYLPPWVPWQPFEDRANYVKAAQILFHEVLADALVWTPASQRSGRTVVRHYKLDDGTLLVVNIDATVLAVLDVWNLESLFVNEGMYVEFDKFLTDFESDFSDFAFKSIQDQVNPVISGARYHAWHATPLGTGYLLQPGGIVLDVQRLIREYGEEPGPVEIDVLAHWSIVDEPESALSPEMEKANAVITETLRKLGIDREAWEVANRLAISAKAGEPMTAREKQLLRYRQDAYKGPVEAAPSVPKKSMASDKAVRKVMSGKKAKRTSRKKEPGHDGTPTATAKRSHPATAG